jgi:hypothetical protein
MKMASDRKEFGMNSGIPFIKIADRVEVTVDLNGGSRGDTPGPCSDSMRAAGNYE